MKTVEYQPWVKLGRVQPSLARCRDSLGIFLLTSSSRTPFSTKEPRVTWNAVQAVQAVLDEIK